MNRVVITGAGTVNPLGHDLGSTLQAFRQGRCAIGALQGIRDQDRLSIGIGAQITGWNPADFLTGRDLAAMDRFTQLACVAGSQAMQQAGLECGSDRGLRRGAIIGTAGGGFSTTEDGYRAVFADGRNRVAPLTVPRLMANAAASHLSMRHGLQGPVFSVSSACASSNHAIGLAFQLVRSGLADVMLAGGADAMMTFGGIKAWEGLRVLSPDGCRPFCASRNGLALGEGAAVLVLERRDHATARGATILAEVLGFGMTADAADLVAPGLDGPARAMRQALADAQRSAGEVGYINAHGTGTRLNDRIEAEAIRAVFGPAADVIALSSTKSLHGHLMGAAGAVELLACLLALREGIVAPTAGLRTTDPDCPVPVIHGQAVKADVSVALSNAFAFGGLNAVLVLGRA